MASREAVGPRSGSRLARPPTRRRDALACEGQSLRTGLDEVAHSFEVDDQVAGHRPLLLPGEDAGEVLVAPQRPVGVVGVLRRASEALVVIRHELRQERVAGFHRREAAQTQLLHQAVLQRFVHPLDAPLRLRAVGADDVDVELGQRAPELRDAPGPAGCAVVVDAENAVLVAVERDRLAVALQVSAGRREVVETRTRPRRSAAPSSAPWRRRRKPAASTPVHAPRTKRARSRRSAPTRPGIRAGVAAGAPCAGSGLVWCSAMVGQSWWQAWGQGTVAVTGLVLAVVSL